MLLRSSLPLTLIALLAAAAHAQPQVEDAALSVERVVTGLAAPTTLAFLGPDDFVVLEKATGRVRRVTNGALQPSAALDLAVNSCGERGLLGVAVHPEFGAGTARDWVYVYYTASGGASDVDDACGSDFVNRLARFTWNGDVLVSPVTLADFPSFTSNHNGGPLAFGPDGMLYGVIGDGGRSGATQNDEDAAGLFEDTGVILRLDENGALPAHNPFDADGVQDDPEDAYFAYGVRNSFGLAFDPFTDVLWDTENGPGEFDEINRIVPGANSGWLDVMGPASLTPGFDPDSDLVQLPGSTYVDPEYSIFDTVAPTGLAFASEATTLGAAHEGSLFVADVNLGNVYEFPLTPARDGLELADRVADDQAELDGFQLARGFAGGITDLEEGPDGDLYVVAIGLGEVWRIGGRPGGGPPAPDLALAKVKAPKRISRRADRSVTKRLKITLVNRGSTPASIDADSVQLAWTSLGACPAPAATLRPPKRGFPLELRPKKKFALRWEVRFECANDGERSRRGVEHGDFDLAITLPSGASAVPLRIDVVQK